MIIDILTASNVPIWKQERIIFAGSNNQEFKSGRIVRMWTDLHGSNLAPIATYTCAADNSVHIDLTDYVRTYPSVGYVYFDGNGFENAVSIAVQVVGLINPAGVIIPFQPLADGGAIIIPPSKMYCTRDYDDVNAELYTTSGTWSVSGMATIATGGRFIGQVEGNFSLMATGYEKKYSPWEMKCDEQYIVVRWVSFTGQERKHIFLMKKQTNSAAVGFSLIHPQNEYDDIKSRTDGFTIYLDGLDPYDYWYYADVLMSSKVEASTDSVNFTQVQVTTKNVTIPDGNNFDGKLEIEVNYKRYDAVAM